MVATDIKSFSDLPLSVRSEMISQPVKLVFSWSTNWFKIPQNLPKTCQQTDLSYFCMYYIFILDTTQYKIFPPLSLFYTEPSKPVVFSPSFEGQIL